MNLCCNCQHRLPTVDDGSLTMANVCRAPEVGFDPAVNPVTGHACYTGEMEDGDKFYAENPHPLCIWVNPNGTCVYFKEKRPRWWAGVMRG